MPVLFPRAREWKSRISRAVTTLLRRAYFRFRLRQTAVDHDLHLRLHGIVSAEHAQFRRSTNRWLIYPASTVELALPKTIEPNDPGEFQAWRSYPSPPAYVYCFPRGLYHGERGAVVDHRGRILTDLLDAQLIDPDVRAFLASFATKTEPDLVDGDALTLSTGWNYFHWLLKMLPRLALAEAAGLDVKKLDALLIEPPSAVQSEGFREARLPAAALRIVDWNRYVHARRLYSTSIPHDVPRWSIDYLQKLFVPLLAHQDMRAKMIYLRRGNTRSRRVQNEDELCAHLAERGIKAHDFESCSFREQVEIVANADVIVAPHGAALANLAFVRSGARVLEILASAQNQKCYWIAARHRSAIYHYVMADPIAREGGGNDFDMFVPLEKIDRAFDFLMSDSETPNE